MTAAFLLTKLAARQMVDTVGEGAVVNISSRSSDMVQTSFVAYAAGKAALNMMTKNMAAELAPRVRVNAIGVGGVATEALEMVLTDDTLRAQFEANTPMRRPGTPEDIACAALYLASPASSWVTGKIFQVDGGTESPSITVPGPAARADAVASGHECRAARDVEGRVADAPEDVDDVVRAVPVRDEAPWHLRRPTADGGRHPVGAVRRPSAEGTGGYAGRFDDRLRVVTGPQLCREQSGRHP